jgi:integrase
MSDTSLALERRSRLVAAVTSLARRLGSALSSLPARPELLLKAIQASDLLNSPSGRAAWKKLRPTVRSAIERCGLSKVPGQYGEPLSKPWQVLAAAMPVSYERYLLSRFMRFQSSSGVHPRDIRQKSANEYHCALASEGLVPQPNGDLRLTCQLWNKASGEVHHWPKTKLLVPNFIKQYTLPFSELPKKLASEIERYLTIRATDDPVDRYGPSGLRSASVDAIRSTLRQHVSILLLSGWKKTEIDSLAKLALASAVKCSASYLSARTTGRPSRSAAQIASVAASIARHWTVVPHGTQRELDDIRGALSRNPARMSSEHLRLAVQFDDERSVEELLCLPRLLLKSAAALPFAERAALLVQTALAIEILINAPLKASQLAGLSVESDFRRFEDGRLAIVVAEHRNLRSRSRTVPLSRECRRIFDTYISRYLNLLTANTAGPLFPGYGNRPKSATVLGRQIKSIAAEFTDLDLRPSAFRVFAAKHYLMHNPGDYSVLAAVLGNWSIDSTKRTYASLSAPSAARAVDHFVEQLARPTHPKARPAERRLRHVQAK